MEKNRNAGCLIRMGLYEFEGSKVKIFLGIHTRSENARPFRDRCPETDQKNDPNIEVIVITAHGTPQNVQDASRYGAGDFITKPFNVPDLINSVNKSLEKRDYNLRLKSFNQYNSAVVIRE